VCVVTISGYPWLFASLIGLRMTATSVSGRIVSHGTLARDYLLDVQGVDMPADAASDYLWVMPVGQFLDPGYLPHGYVDH